MSESPKTTKEASALVYLVEELGDARLLCDQLQRYVQRAVQLIEKSEKRDHFFEVAGDILEGLPETAVKLDKALKAVALATNRIDYEEVRQDLRPDKVDELERVLDEVRVRPIRRRGNPMNPQEVIQKLRNLAATARTSGQVPSAEALSLIAALEEGSPKTASDGAEKFACGCESMADALQSPPEGVVPSRIRLASLLRQTVASEMDVMMAAAAAPKDLQDMMDHAVKVLKQNYEKDLDKFEDRKNAVQVWSLLHGLPTTWTQGSSNPNFSRKKHFFKGDASDEAKEWIKSVTDARLSTVIKKALKNRWPELASLLDSHKLKAASDDSEEDEGHDKTAADATRAMERTVNVVKAQLKELEHSLSVYKKDPGKNAPQLDNFKAALAQINRMQRMVERAKTASDDEEQDEGHDKTAGLDLKQQHSLHEKNLKEFQSWLRGGKSIEAWAEKGRDILSSLYRSLHYFRLALDPSDEVQADLQRVLKNYERRVDSFSAVLDKLDFGISEALGGGSATQGFFMDRATVRNIEDAIKVQQGVRVAADDEEREARFEEGKPADPTKNMSPEDAAKWKSQKEKNKDKFTKESTSTVDLWNDLHNAKNALMDDDTYRGDSSARRLATALEGVLSLANQWGDKVLSSQKMKALDKIEKVVTSVARSTSNSDARRSLQDALKAIDHDRREFKQLSSIGLLRAASDVDWKAQTETKFTKEAALKSKDKKVVEAFTDKKPLQGDTLETDGKQLKYFGGKSTVVAMWNGGVIVRGDDSGSRTDDSIVRYIKKVAPKNHLKLAASSLDWKA